MVLSRVILHSGASTAQEEIYESHFWGAEEMRTFCHFNPLKRSFRISRVYRAPLAPFLIDWNLRRIGSLPLPKQVRFLSSLSSVWVRSIWQVAEKAAGKFGDASISRASAKGIPRSEFKVSCDIITFTTSRFRGMFAIAEGFQATWFDSLKF